MLLERGEGELAELLGALGLEEVRAAVERRRTGRRSADRASWWVATAACAALARSAVTRAEERVVGIGSLLVPPAPSSYPAPAGGVRRDGPPETELVSCRIRAPRPSLGARNPPCGPRPMRPFQEVSVEVDPYDAAVRRAPVGADEDPTEDAPHAREATAKRVEGDAWLRRANVAMPKEKRTRFEVMGIAVVPAWRTRDGEGRSDELTRSARVANFARRSFERFPQRHGGKLPRCGGGMPLRGSRQHQRGRSLNDGTALASAGTRHGSVLVRSEDRRPADRDQRPSRCSGTRVALLRLMALRPFVVRRHSLLLALAALAAAAACPSTEGGAPWTPRPR